MQHSAVVQINSVGASRIEAQVRQARELVQKCQFLPALAAVQALQAEVPENRDVLYLSAVCQRYLGRVADALSTLEHLEAIHPDYGRLFQERGHCYRSLDNVAAALAAYEQAVARNHTLIASWKALGRLRQRLGQESQAQAAAAHVVQLRNQPREILNAANMLAEGELASAEQLLRGYLRRNGNHFEAMRLLAQIRVKQDLLDDAEFLLERVLVFAPDYHAARYEYANVLCQRHKDARALEEARKLLQIEPGNRAFRTVYANACVGLGRHQEAVGTFRDLLAGAPQPADLHLSIGHALKALGRQAEAIRSYRAAADARPSFGDAYWSLANLKTYHFTAEEFTRMRAEEARAGTSVTDQLHLCFALGKALEDRGDYPQSFHYYERGNVLVQRRLRYKREALELVLQAQTRLCTREFFAERAGSGSDRSDPIFIVGLPRSGSTLLEQILASHSQVDGTMELPDIPRLVHQLNGCEESGQPPRYPAILAQLEPPRLRQLGERYLADTQVFRTGKPFFIDKMPNNFRHIGLIHLILPNATIIDARREPMACCFSNFKQLFASGQEFTYSLDDIGHYYRCYVTLMEHWNSVLPGKILRVQHEELLQDFAGQVKRILDFVGLKFEATCLEFYRTERSVRTASSEQVRQPISKERTEQWRHFGPWLGPLKRALADMTQANIVA
jgi:tetratricopeptide (TPR) repeat protein